MPLCKTKDSIQNNQGKELEITFKNHSTYHFQTYLTLESPGKLSANVDSQAIPNLPNVISNKARSRVPPSLDGCSEWSRLRITVRNTAGEQVRDVSSEALDAFLPYKGAQLTSRRRWLSPVCLMSPPELFVLWHAACLRMHFTQLWAWTGPSPVTIHDLLFRVKPTIFPLATHIQIALKCILQLPFRKVNSTMFYWSHESKKRNNKKAKYHFCLVTWKSGYYHMITQAGNEIKIKFHQNSICNFVAATELM